MKEKKRDMPGVSQAATNQWVQSRTYRKKGEKSLRQNIDEENRLI